jgi:hypothetical protein
VLLVNARHIIAINLLNFCVWGDVHYMVDVCSIEFFGLIEINRCVLQATRSVGAGKNITQLRNSGSCKVLSPALVKL